VVLSHDIQSNGILYADVCFDYSGVHHTDVELLGLFGRMLLECGTDSLSELELHQHINTETGGISVSYLNSLRHTSNKVSFPDDVTLHLALRGKATTDKVPLLFDIFREILSNAKLDNQKRFIEMLKETKAAKESAVISSGHSYAATRLGSKFSYLGYLAENSSGITFISRLSALLEQATNDWPTVLARLQRMRNAIYVRKTSDSVGKSPSLVINLTGSKDVLEQSRQAVDDFLAKVPAIDTSAGAPATAVTGSTLATCPVSFGQTEAHSNEGFMIPSQVNYVVQGGQLLMPGEDLTTIKTGSFSVISKYLSTSYLWDHVRVLGGAYGSSCSFGVDSGRFLFSSYRDPNVQDTMHVYRNTSAFLESQLTPQSAEVDLDGSVNDTDESTVGVSDEVLLQFIIGSIGDLDSPQSPDQEGFGSLGEFLKGEPAEDRQRYRDEILSTNREDFAMFAERLSVMLADPSRCSTVVFGSETALQRSNQQNEVSDPGRLLELNHAVPAVGNKTSE
jgi:presequence protease